ncbi:hypothetical protein Tco_1478356 [Tanacetum coccineum]
MRWPFSGKSRRKTTTTVSLHSLLIASAAFTGIGLLLLTLRSLDDPLLSTSHLVSDDVSSVVEDEKVVVNKKSKGCATVEEMGDQFRGGGFFDVRDLIRLIEIEICNYVIDVEDVFDLRFKMRDLVDVRFVSVNSS